MAIVGGYLELQAVGLHHAVPILPVARDLYILFFAAKDSRAERQFALRYVVRPSQRFFPLITRQVGGTRHSTFSAQNSAPR